MYQVILLIHVFAAICIVGLVLMQQGKGAAVGAAFGSGASQTIFGSRGSGSFLFRLTMSFMLVFFITSISLNYIATHAYKQSRTITLPASMQQPAPLPQQTTAPVQQQIPVTTAPVAPAAPIQQQTIIPAPEAPVEQQTEVPVEQQTIAPVAPEAPVEQQTTVPVAPASPAQQQTTTPVPVQEQTTVSPSEIPTKQ